MGSGAIRAGRAFVELLVGEKGLRSGLDKAGKTLKAWGAGVSAGGLKLAGAGAAIVAPLAAASKVFAGMGDELAKASARTGVGVEALSALKYAADQSGTSLEGLESGLRKMSKLIVSAAEGADGADDTLRDLGLTLDDLKNLTPDEQFLKIADALSKIENPTVRAAKALDVFGKGGAELLPLMSDGAGGIKELMARAQELGLTMSTEDAKAAEEYGDRLDDLFAVMKRGVATIGAAVVPVFKAVAVQLTDLAVKAGKWISENREMFATALKVGAGILAAGAALFVLGKAIATVGVVVSGVGSAMGVFKAVAGTLATVLTTVLTSGIGLVLAGLAGLALYLAYNTEVGQKAMAALGGYFGTLKDIATTALGGITDALKAGDFALAAKILWLGLQAEWAAGIQPLKDAWESFRAVMVKVAVGAFNGVLAAWDVARNFLTEGWIQMTAAMTAVWAKFAGGVKTIWEDTQATLAGMFIEMGVGGLDEDQKAQAIEGLENDRAAAVQRITDEKDAEVAAAEAKRTADLAAEKKRHEDALAAAGNDYADTAGAADDLASKAKAANAAATAKAKADLAAARQQATDAVKAMPPTPDLPPKPKLPTPDELAAGLEGLNKKTTSRGTFSANFDSVQSGNAISRIVKATEDTAKNTKGINKYGPGILFQ